VSSKPAGEDSAVIVLAAPMTGRQRAVGLAMSEILRDEIAALNRSGGVAGRRLVLATVDDGCSSEVASVAAEAALARDPVAVIGHPCSSAAIAAAARYAPAQRMLLATGVRHPAFAAPRVGPLTFRVSGRDDLLGRAVASRLTKLCPSGSQIVIIHDRTQLSRKLVDSVTRDLRSGGVRAAAELTIVAGEADYAKTVSALADRKPGVILFAGFPAEGAILLRQLRSANLRAAFLATDTHAAAEFVADAGALLDGSVEVMMPIPVVALDSAPGDQVGNDAPTESFASLAATETRTALQIWAKAASKAGTLTPTAIAHQLQHGSAAEIGVAFDNSGNAETPSFAPFQREGGRWVRVSD